MRWQNFEVESLFFFMKSEAESSAERKRQEIWMFEDSGKILKSWCSEWKKK